MFVPKPLKDEIADMLVGAFPWMMILSLGLVVAAGHLGAWPVVQGIAGIWAFGLVGSVVIPMIFCAIGWVVEMLVRPFVLRRERLDRAIQREAEIELARRRREDPELLATEMQAWAMAHRAGIEASLARTASRYRERT